MLGTIFRHPFSGLIGQHNYLGTQLPFYNLIFLIRYLQKREGKYLVLLILALLAVVLNTSRFGLVAFLLTYLGIALFTIKLSGNKGAVIIALSTLFLSFIVLMLPLLVEGWMHYFQYQNTLAFRLARYPAFVRTFSLSRSVSIFLGNSVSEVSDLIIRSQVGIKSFENQLLSTLYNYGLVGLVVSIFWLIALFKQFLRLPRIWKNIGYMLIINMIAVSLISDLLFRYSIFPFVTLLYIYIRSKTKDSYVQDSRVAIFSNAN